MGKITNMTLAEWISMRILEILDKTSMTLAGLANFSEISESRLQRYFHKNSTISVEAVAKLCDSLSIPMAHFFDESMPLRIATGTHSNFGRFRTKFFPLGKKFFTDEVTDKNQLQTTQKLDHRYQRESVMHLIFDSDYFQDPRTIEQIIAAAEKAYQITFKFDRIASLLRKYVAEGYLERKVLPRGYSRSRQYTYCRTSNKRQIAAKEEIAVIERTPVLIR
ncbi:helix-turn-helix transcriptional regulator [Sphingobacterium multivorum]|uniref:Helix-turn-helix transcriptional regulator n=1 Tax=Sphingobacterium multivorum TaxID=28454 RepID=A0ABX7CWF8_SPHMU|nr:helix-turn-helix transcriptional regulator [Sphingobacterium multivorum]QQT32935.1 helix-turn-helix transcriptional regulator [Sphingobacterium multivorum]QQT56049.1 helix-turn-helix transcriptional regulator [Sphingobacterium multivorum]